MPPSLVRRRAGAGPIFTRCWRWLLAVLGEQRRIAPSPGPGAGRRAWPAVVLYYCYAGVHTSVVAAAIHAGMLPQARPTRGDIASLAAFDRPAPLRFGVPRPLATDEAGRLVAAAGLGMLRHRVARAIRTAAAGAELSPRIRLVPTLECAGPLLRAGGFCSQRLGWRALGRRAVLADLLRHYPALVEAARAGKTGPSLDGRGGGGG